MLSLADKLNQVPGEKSYWANVLSETEQEIKSLERKKKYIIKTLQKKLIDNSEIKINKSTLDKIEESQDVEEINLQIDELKLNFKQLERIYDCVKYIAKDFENIIKFIQLQEG
jgi:predicted RNase H-like nuclease (RuvC/YqgF family)